MRRLTVDTAARHRGQRPRRAHFAVRCVLPVCHVCAAWHMYACTAIGILQNVYVMFFRVPFLLCGSSEFQVGHAPQRGLRRAAASVHHQAPPARCVPHRLALVHVVVARIPLPDRGAAHWEALSPVPTRRRRGG